MALGNKWPVEVCDEPDWHNNTLKLDSMTLLVFGPKLFLILNRAARFTDSSIDETPDIFQQTTLSPNQVSIVLHSLVPDPGVNKIIVT